MPTHYSDSKSICSKIVDGSLSRSIAMVQLKTLCFSRDTIKLIIDCATAENTVKNNT